MNNSFVYKQFLYGGNKKYKQKCRKMLLKKTKHESNVNRMLNTIKKYAQKNWHTSTSYLATFSVIHNAIKCITLDYIMYN